MTATITVKCQRKLVMGTPFAVIVALQIDGRSRRVRAKGRRRSARPMSQKERVRSATEGGVMFDTDSPGSVTIDTG